MAALTVKSPQTPDKCATGTFRTGLRVFHLSELMRRDGSSSGFRVNPLWVQTNQMCDFCVGGFRNPELKLICYWIQQLLVENHHSVLVDAH